MTSSNIAAAKSGITQPKKFVESNPDLAAQWHPTKNSHLDINTVMTNCKEDAWWVCKEGHEWQSSPQTRNSKKTGCPFCAGKQAWPGYNDLASKFPLIAAQWHPTKNGNTTPQDILSTSRELTWWQCSVHPEHEWEATVANRTRYDDTDKCSMCVGRVVIAGINDLASSNPDVASEWDYDKNTKTPETVTPQSNTKVNWKCAQGHEWEAKIVTRTKGKMCPECSGETSTKRGLLIDEFPTIAAQWHPTKNSGLILAAITSASGKKVWWQCDKGHEWEAYIANRTAFPQRGCPQCKGVRLAPGRNDLATLNPTLSAEWHPTKNGDLSPSQVTARNSKRVWWQCDKGHEWETSILSRVRGNGCPVCGNKQLLEGYNDVATCYPLLLNEWDYEKNEVLPSQVLRGSSASFWWKCAKNDRHSWQASLLNRVKSNRPSGCPYCNNKKVLQGEDDLETKFPDIASEWHPSKNGSLHACDVRPLSKKIVWWQCGKGHEWEAKVANRARGMSLCPQCFNSKFSSKAERDIADFVRSLGFVVRTNDRRALGVNRELDIFVPEKMFAIEFNGVYWHTEQYKSRDYHAEKVALCASKGITLYQVWEDDWVARKEVVLRGIAHRLNVATKMSELYPELPAFWFERIAARKLRVMEIDVATAFDFLNTHHIQGSVPGSWYMGLVDSEERVRALLVVKKSAKKGQYSIERYATAGIIAGGFTRLLSAMEKKLGSGWFVTFSDSQLSDGGLYVNNGFVQDKLLRPDYSYLVNERRVHKFNYRKVKFKESPDLQYVEGLTERELAELNGLPRVWDSGKVRWVKTFGV